MKRITTFIFTLVALSGCGRKNNMAASPDSLTPTAVNDKPAAAPVETVFVAEVPPPAPRRPPRPAPPPPPPSGTKAPARQGGTLDAGTEIATTLTDSIHSAWNGPGDRVTARVNDDVMDAGRVVIPAGSVVTYRIDAIGPATSRGERGTLGITAESVRIGGRTYPMSGTASDYNFEMKARSINAGDVATAAGGAAIGAIIGRVIGGKTGTIVGAVGGGAAGTAVAAKNADRDIIVHAGTAVTLVLLDHITR